MIRRMLVIALTAVGALAVLLVTAGAAGAHVTVVAPGAASGGSDQEITFRVPTESDTASTTGLKLQLPSDTPIASVLVRPIPGWTFTATTSKLAKPITTDDGQITEAVTEIDWTASSGAGIGPGQYQEFTIIAGQLPDADSLTFKAIQAYSDGTSVSWTDVKAKGSTADLDHPAPVLDLTAAQASSSTGGSSNTGAIILAIVALVVAVGALGLAIVTRAVVTRAKQRPDTGDAT